MILPPLQLGEVDECVRRWREGVMRESERLEEVECDMSQQVSSKMKNNWITSYDLLHSYVEWKKRWRNGVRSSVKSCQSNTHILLPLIIDSFFF